MSNTRIGRRGAASVVAVAMAATAVLSVASPVHADDFVVSSSADSGPNTLRQAIIDANAASGPDTITFALAAGTEIDLLSSLPVLTGDLAVTSPTDVVIDGGGAHSVFHGGVDLSLEGFSITGGFRSRGGAVDVNGGDVTLTDMRFTNNEASDSGGAVNVNLGSLDVTTTRFANNAAAGSGGAIRHFAMGTRDHTVTISQSEFVDNVANSATIGGGAIVFDGGGIGTIVSTEFADNSAERFGGAIYARGALLEIDASSFSANEITNAAGGGGALFVRDSFGVGGVNVPGSLDVAASTFSGNLSANGGGALDLSDVDADIVDTTFDGNVATDFGGAISVFRGETDIQSTTFVANRSTAGSGGAIRASASSSPGVDIGSLQITNSTLSGNSASTGAGLSTIGQISTFLRHSTVTANSAAALGGGVHATGPLVVEHSIVGGNTAASGGADIDGTVSSVTWSLVSDTSGAVFSTASDNLLDMPAALEALADNGGATLTHRPSPSSPVVDAGDPNFTPPPSTDQRAGVRVAGSRIDIGAVEMAPGSFRIEPATARVDEGSSVAATIRRVGGSDGAATVRVATVDVSAVAGVDYTAISTVLTWTDGDATPRTVSTSAIEDIADDIDETFEVRLSSPTGASLGTPSASVITIENIPTPFVVPVDPARLVDTRAGEVTVDGRFQEIGVRGAGTTLTLDVTGRAGVPADAQAVVVNVTAVNPTRVGFLTIFPCDEDQPTASSLNYAPGAVVGNEVVARLDGDGSICVFTSGATNYTADVVGYVPANSPYRPLTPARLADTREGAVTIDGDVSGDGLLAADSVFEIQVGGRAGVPTSAAAVVVNVTAIAPQGNGFLSVWPCGDDRPVASSLNYLEGVTRGNEIVAKLSPTGSLCIYAQRALDLAVDLVGWLPPAASYTAVEPARFVDTRPGESTADGRLQGFGRLAAGSTLRVKIAGRGDVPDLATAAVVNLAAIGAAERGFFTVYDCEGDRPLASSLNYAAGSNVANEIIAGLNDNGELCVYTLRDIHLALDVVGYAS